MADMTLSVSQNTMSDVNTQKQQLRCAIGWMTYHIIDTVEVRSIFLIIEIPTQNSFMTKKEAQLITHHRSTY